MCYLWLTSHRWDWLLPRVVPSVERGRGGGSTALSSRPSDQKFSTDWPTLQFCMIKVCSSTTWISSTSRCLLMFMRYCPDSWGIDFMLLLSERISVWTVLRQHHQGTTQCAVTSNEVGCLASRCPGHQLLATYLPFRSHFCISVHVTHAYCFPYLIIGTGKCHSTAGALRWPVVIRASSHWYVQFLWFYFVQVIPSCY